MPLYSFQCDNPECKLFEKEIEEQVKLAELDTKEIFCKKCKTKLTRLIGYTRARHASWSQWKIGLKGNE